MLTTIIQDFALFIIVAVLLLVVPIIAGMIHDEISEFILQEKDRRAKVRADDDDFFTNLVKEHKRDIWDWRPSGVLVHRWRATGNHRASVLGSGTPARVQGLQASSRNRRAHQARHRAGGDVGAAYA